MSDFMDFDTKGEIALSLSTVKTLTHKNSVFSHFFYPNKTCH